MASRPRTAALHGIGADTTSPSFGHHNDPTEEEDDDDVGMFAFLPPAPASAGPVSPDMSSAYPPGTAASALPYSPGMFNRAPNPSTIEPASALSPAAAYALAESQRLDNEPTDVRRRGSWQHPSTPESMANSPNPYEVHLAADSRRTSDGSAVKPDFYPAHWSSHHESDLGSQTGIEMSDYERQMRMHGLGSHGTNETELEKMDRNPCLEMNSMMMDEEEEEEDSPYPEVRASVSNIDDLEMPCLTFRTWFLGTFFAIIVTALNTFFVFRYPAPSISPILVQILAYPLGKLLAWTLPINTWYFPKWTRRLGFAESFSFNPGPFNIKEHTALVIVANIATTPALALNFSVSAEIFYGVDLGVGFDLLFLLTTTTIGFGIAGLLRRFLVWPAVMIWPQNLVFCTLLNTLHAEDDDYDDDDAARGMSRFRFLCYVFTGAFLWYFLPGFLFTALSAFSFICWAAPQNVVVNQLFGVSSGLGMSLLTFDWSQIAFIYSPLVVPWWAQVNIFCAFVIAFWIIAPAMYYTNVWDSAFLPISTSTVFDRFGAPYQTAAVVDTASMALNLTAYEEYSPLYLPVTFATTYGIALMLTSSLVVHTAIYHGQDIYRGLLKLKISEDIHMKLMRAYPEVPEWWYLGTLAISVGLSIVAVACWDTQMPVWALIVCLAVGFVYVLPAGIVFAMTSTSPNINIPLQIIAGYLTPGRPFANMLFKTYASQSIGVGLNFVQDLKLGHYMKLPPRSTYTLQITSTVIAAFVQVGVKRWLIANVNDFCDPRNSARLVCPQTRVFYSASIIWGLIGPDRILGPGRLYNPLLWWLLAGAIAPVITWALARRYPKSLFRYINVPVALAGAGFMPPATGINYSSWFLFGFMFQFVLRRYRFRWWSKYNFILSAGLDAGTVSCIVIIFLVLQLPRGGSIELNWWGNTVYTETLDWQGAAYKTVPEEGFGPSTWT